MQNADYHGYIVLSLSVRITLSARTFLFYSIILQNANFVQFLIIILYPVYFYHYIRKHFCISLYVPRTKRVSSLLNSISGPIAIFIFPSVLIARILMLYFLRISSSPIVFPIQSPGTSTSKIACESSTSI